MGLENSQERLSPLLTHFEINKDFCCLERVKKNSHYFMEHGCVSIDLWMHDHTIDLDCADLLAIKVSLIHAWMPNKGTALLQSNFQQ